MTNIRSKNLTIGYCTNVHAGVDLPTIRSNLAQYAVAVRENLIQRNVYHQEDHLGVGLWLPDAASRELVQGDNLIDFAKFLSQHQLSAFTINGFPFDNFHQDIVKHQVYLPTWESRQRLEYTQRLADILVAIMPSDDTASTPPIGSISTLPIGWPNNPDAAANDQACDLAVAGKHFRELADHLAKIEAATGKRIVVAIEPEPGCVLDMTADVIEFFENQLPEANHRRHITVCHDVCHSAVMMETQTEVLGRLGKAGVTIGKVQISSAIVIQWNAMSIPRRNEAIEQLAEFAEDRYLHQTGRRTKDGDFVLSEDLPALIESARASRDDSGQIVTDKTWVVHFHVPIFLERFRHLATSRQEILDVLLTLCRNPSTIEFTGHLEVETYAWTVLPESMRRRGLAEDIAEEIQWLQNAVSLVG